MTLGRSKRRFLSLVFILKYINQIITDRLFRAIRLKLLTVAGFLVLSFSLFPKIRASPRKDLWLVDVFFVVLTFGLPKEQ